MPKGWDAIEEQSSALQEQREQFGQGFKPELRVGVKHQGPFIVRFLEQGQDVSNYAVHTYKVPNPQVPGGFSDRRFTCLNQAPWSDPNCPGCTSGMKRKHRGVFNVIQRNRAIYRKGADGKTIKTATGDYITDGYADTVVIANVGGPTAEALRKADASYRGLMSRDFQITYSGDTFQAYSLAPMLDNQGNANATPMSEADHQLAQAKHDLDEYMKPPTLQEAAQLVARYGGNSGVQNQSHAGAPAGPGGMQQPQQNPLLAGMQVPAGTNVLAGALGGTGQPPAQPQQPAPAPVPPVQQG